MLHRTRFGALPTLQPPNKNPHPSPKFGLAIGAYADDVSHARKVQRELEKQKERLPGLESINIGRTLDHKEGLACVIETTDDPKNTQTQTHMTETDIEILKLLRKLPGFEVIIAAATRDLLPNSTDEAWSVAESPKPGLTYIDDNQFEPTGVPKVRTLDLTA